MKVYNSKEATKIMLNDPHMTVESLKVVCLEDIWVNPSICQYMSEHYLLPCHTTSLPTTMSLVSLEKQQQIPLDTPVEVLFLCYYNVQMTNANLSLVLKLMKWRLKCRQ